jgi:hypothetical protein
MRIRLGYLAETGRARLPIYRPAGADDGSLAFISEPQVDPFSFFSRPHRGCGLSFICWCREVFLRLRVCMR